MDCGSCGLEGAPVVTSGGNSPSSAGIPLLPEKHCASSDETCGAAGVSTGPEGVPVVTSADNSPPRTGIPLPCDSVDETCESAAGGTAPLEAQICTGFSKSISLDVKKGLQKCATFPPSSGQAQQEDGSCCHADDGLTGAPAYERSVSLPHPTLKLIPAMKGGREKNGIASPTENRHVKWAPDVYDPPVTSVCRSVTNSYQRRSKHRNKEKNKQKKKHKGKSKKNQQNSTQNSSVLQVPDLGLKGVSTTGGQSSVDDLSKHEAGIMDSMGSQEAKCGSSFLRESVAKMHFSIAEAS
ncbi:unnamed protein product [Miscanthus lutarioriparius]|uniref:BRI1-KD interacting protein 130 n=1 Tax=Miscanthus lutarioriparius TaxID=422564 RepID=A0A811RU32_9POAL|nr:unnamed protein product [Miscanthus lutarioriparius]